MSPDRCEDLNAEAADADVNAAYFMAETHNAANATAWMLGQDQLARTLFPVGTGNSRASKVIAMATTASENSSSRSVARASYPGTLSGSCVSGTR